MSYQGFFENCLQAAQKQYKKLLDTPRSRGGGLGKEVEEVTSQIQRSIKYCEIETESGKHLISEFQKIDFNNLSKERAEIKKSLAKEKKSSRR